MDAPLKDYCKVGIIHFMLWKDALRGEGDYSTVDILLDDPYFDAIEMTQIKDDATRKSIAGKIKVSGKALGFGAQPVQLTQQLDINHLDEAERQKAAKAVIDVIPQAYELGAGGFAVLSGKTVDPAKKDQAMGQLVVSLKEIAAELKKQGDIPLILETFDTLSYGKNCLIGSSIDAAKIAARVREEFPSFGIMIDLSHLPLQGESAKQAVDNVRDYLVHAHMGNCVMNKPDHSMNGDEHPPLADPDGENGVEALAAYLKALLDAGYLNKDKRPFLSFEVCIYDQWAQDTLIKQSKEILDAAWAMV